MKKTARVLFLLLIIGPANAGNWNNSSPFVEMMRFMLGMFEMMQLSQGFSGHAGYSSTPFGYRQYRQYRPAYPAPPGSTPFLSRQHNMLEGAWVSRNHILLAIKQNYARMYWSREQYGNFYVEILPGHLRLIDADTGQTQGFEYKLKDNQLILRDKQGRVIHFLRLNMESSPPPTEPAGNFWDPNTR